MDFTIIHVDNHLLVVNKPAGLLTQPDDTGRDSLQNRAKEWLKIQYAKPGNVFLEPIHRLDRPVGGIIVFARTSKALSRLNESMRQKELEKVYHAIVEGRVPSQEAVLENYLFHDDFHARVVPKTYPQAKLARLKYSVLKTVGKYSLLEVKLETGRYHQIRLQLATIGCPILGDYRYGSTTAFFPHDGIALQHVCLSVAHPITHETTIFKAPTPHSWQQFLSLS